MLEGRRDRPVDGAEPAAADQVHQPVRGAGQVGWDTPVNFLAWRDPGGAQVTGRLLTRQVGDLTNESTVQVSGTDTTVITHARHELTAAGLLRTSHGLVATVVHQRVGNDNVHRWGDGANANPESIDATWTDQATSLVAGISRFAGLTDIAQRYAMNATAFLDPAGRYGVTMTFTDNANGRIAGFGNRS